MNEIEIDRERERTSNTQNRIKEEKERGEQK
jgi:hypothetical protein